MHTRHIEHTREEPRIKPVNRKHFHFAVLASFTGHRVQDSGTSSAKQLGVVSQPLGTILLSKSHHKAFGFCDPV